MLVPIGPQHLYCVLPGHRRIRKRLRQRRRMPRHPRLALHSNPVRRTPVQRMRIVPPLHERPQQITNHRPADLQSNIVPRRPIAVPRIHRRLLRIPQMPGIVPALVTQIDPAHEGHVPRRITPMPDHEQFLMMGRQPPDPLIEQHLRTGLVELGPEQLVLLRVERQVIRMRPPEQSRVLRRPTAPGRTTRRPTVGPSGYSASSASPRQSVK